MKAHHVWRKCRCLLTKNGTVADNLHEGYSLSSSKNGFYKFKTSKMQEVPG